MKKPNRKVFNECIDIDFQMILLFKLDQGVPGIIQGGFQGHTGFNTKDDIFENGKGVDKHEMLMHHPNPGSDSIMGTVDFQFIALNPDTS